MMQDRLLPKDKHDVESVHELTKLGQPIIDPLLPRLLEWIQDMNWPIAYPMSRLLASIGRPLVPHVIQVLRGEDYVWKYWCIEHVVRSMQVEERNDFRSELERLAYSPTEGDKSEEVDIVAKEALNEML